MQLTNCNLCHLDYTAPILQSIRFLVLPLAIALLQDLVDESFPVLIFGIIDIIALTLQALIFTSLHLYEHSGDNLAELKADRNKAAD